MCAGCHVPSQDDNTYTKDFMLDTAESVCMRWY